MTGICAGRVVIITGAGRGLGRAHALEFARQGAKVVVNDLGAELDGHGSSTGPTGEVVEEIRAAGGDAMANGADVADWRQTEALVASALDAYGRLDVVVNNAGFLRDRMFFSTGEDEWDAVIGVHLKGHFCLSRHAAAHWREQSKAGHQVDGRIINTSSGAGLLGSVGQASYAAAKAGIAALTLVQAAELARYGVTANAIAPAARTRMTEQVFADTMAEPGEGEFDAMAPENVSPLVVWLASAEARDVTGRVFEVEAGKISVADGWQHGPEIDKGARWDPADVGPAVRDLIAKAPAPGAGLRCFVMRAPIERPNLLWRAFVIGGVGTMGVLSLSDDAWQVWEDNVTHTVPRSAIRAMFAGTIGLHVLEALVVHRKAKRAGVAHVGAWTRTALLYGFPTFTKLARTTA